MRGMRSSVLLNFTLFVCKFILTLYSPFGRFILFNYVGKEGKESKGVICPEMGMKKALNPLGIKGLKAGTRERN